MGRIDADSQNPVTPAYTGPIEGEAVQDLAATTVISGKDTLEASQKSGNYRGVNGVITEADKPALHPVDRTKLSSSHLGESNTFVQTNPYIKSSFLSQFFAKMLDLLTQNTHIHLDEASAELLVRDMLSQLAKDSGALAKALTQKQAREQMVQAVMSFVNAGVSAMSFAEYSRNLGASKNEVGADITAQRKEVEKAEQKANIGAGDQITDMTIPDNAAAVAAREKLKRMEANVDQSSFEKLRRRDEQTRTLTEVQKQVVNGIQGILIASIKTEASFEEEAQKLTEGFMQAMNKYSESSTKQRDMAASNFDKFFEALIRMIQQSNQAFNINSRG